MSSIKKNFAYNFAYQILAIVLPFITAPYVSRVIKAEGVGLYSYTYSIASYFLMFAMLGINNHGSRSIAATTKNKHELGKCFINNYVIQFGVGCLALGIYLVYAFAIEKENKMFALLQVFVVLSGIFDINWFFWGLEKFKLTVIRNTVCKLLSIICIFIFVKNSNDFWKYVLIMSLSVLINQIILWKFLLREIEFVKPNFKLIKANLKPILVLFFPILSYSLYRIMDKIMVGSYSNMSELGYYENAERILNIPIGIITALGNVMLPRISNLLSRGESDSQMKYIKLSMMFVSMVESALFFGIAAVSKLFVPIYYGKEFIRTGSILQIIIFTALISGWANVIRTQVLIPKKNDNVYVMSMLSAAAVNFILNLIFIPRYGAMGAVVGTVCAELLVLILQAIAVRREIDILSIIKENYIYPLIGFIMFICIKIIEHFNTFTPITKLALAIVLGGAMYILLCFAYLCLNKKHERLRNGRS